MAGVLDSLGIDKSQLVTTPLESPPPSVLDTLGINKAEIITTPVEEEKRNTLDSLGIDKAQLVQEDSAPKTTKAEASENEITYKEIADISTKHKVPVNILLDKIGFFGGELQGSPERGFAQLVNEQGPGFASDSVLMGIPQKYAIETAETEEAKNALMDLRQLAESKKSFGRIAAEIGGGLLTPGLGMAKAGIKGAMAGSALMGGTELATRANRGEELEQFGKGAAIGGVAGGVLGGIAKVVGKKLAGRTEKAADEILEAQQKSPDIAERITEIAEKRQAVTDIEKKILRDDDLTDDEIIKVFGEEPSLKEFEEHQKFLKKDLEGQTGQSLDDLDRQGILDESHEALTRLNLIDKAIRETEKAGKEIVRDQETATVKVGQFFSDNLPRAKTYDGQIGSEISQTLNEASKNLNAYQSLAEVPLTRLTKLRRELSKNKVDPKEVSKRIEAGETAPELEAWKQFFEENRVAINDLGGNIQKRENYIPNKPMALPKFITALKKRSRETGAGNIKGTREFSEKITTDPSFEELVKVVSRSNKEAATDPRVFQSELTNMTQVTPVASDKLSLIQSSALKRDAEELPDFVRELDVGILARDWLQQNLKTVYLRKPLGKLKEQQAIAKKVGRPDVEKFINGIVTEITGQSAGEVPSSLAKRIALEHKTSFLDKAEQATNPLLKGIYKSGAEAPEMINQALNNMYPSVLSLNPKNVLQNLSTVTLQTIPEFGSKAAPDVAAAFGDIAMFKIKGMPRKLSQEMAVKLGKTPGDVHVFSDIGELLANEKLLPPNWHGEISKGLKDTVSGNRAVNASGDMLDSVNNGLMYGFIKSEQLARAQGFFTGQRLGNKIMSMSDIDARKFIGRIDDASTQRRLLKLRETKDTEAAQTVLTDYINANHLFHYDKVNMSEYGRVMGPVFSMFSKWPTTMWGKVLNNYQNKLPNKSKRLLKQYLAPFAGLAAIDSAIRNNMEDPESNVKKFIAGHDGLSAWAGVSAVPVMSEALRAGERRFMDEKPRQFQSGRGGILGSTPIGQFGGGLWEAIVADEDASNKVSKAIQEAVIFTPAGPLLKVLGETLPKALGEPIKRESGEGRIERQLRGISETFK